MNILGISGLYHDSAACLISGGVIVAAAQEERFTRIKNDPSFPVHSIRFCMQASGLNPSDLDAVCYYDNSLLTLDRWLKNCIQESPNNGEMLRKSYTRLFGQKLWVHHLAAEAVGGLGKLGRLLVCEHHIAHASSAFYPSPFQSAAILTLDGVGEWATTTIGHGRDNAITLLKQINYPHSLGMLYSAVTSFCGFKVNSGEYKLMGLAPYGSPVYYDLIRDHLIDLKPDGSFRLNTDFFAFTREERMTDETFGGLFSEPKREPESPITKREMDLAASIQKLTEEIILALAKTAKDITGEARLCLAGGVALNCVANGKLLREGLFEDIWIQPASGDAGGSLGCALFAYHSHFANPRSASPRGNQKGSYLGPTFSPAVIENFLDGNQIPRRSFSNKYELAAELARQLADNKAIGLFHGRMEFGPRALGNRSIIANPMDPNMQLKLNLQIKFRESFRPFAPSVLAEEAARFFDLKGESPFMLLVAPVREELRRDFELPDWFRRDGGNMLPLVSVNRSTIPAVTHVDYSARIQTVSESDNPFFHAVIREFAKLTGCPVVVNTSFNVRGEPIVCSPEEAYACFMRTDLDLLVLEDLLLTKEGQPAFDDQKNWRQIYALD